MGRLSAKRWNKLVEAIEKRYQEYLDEAMEALLADGYPPFTTPLPEREVYNRLIAMRDAGDPAFWQDPEAVSELAKLAAKFGHPERMTLSPYGQESHLESTQSLRREGWR